MERIKLLTQENAQLRAEVGSMHDRLAVVERIVTDGGYSVSATRSRALRDEHGKLEVKGKAAVGFWTAIVVIVAIIAFAEVIKTRHRTRHGITTDAMGSEKPVAPPANPRSSARSGTARAGEGARTHRHGGTGNQAALAEIESLRGK